MRRRGTLSSREICAPLAVSRSRNKSTRPCRSPLVWTALHRRHRSPPRWRLERGSRTGVDQSFFQGMKTRHGVHPGLHCHAFHIPWRSNPPYSRGNPVQISGRHSQTGVVFKSNTACNGLQWKPDTYFHVYLCSGCRQMAVKICENFVNNHDVHVFSSGPSALMYAAEGAGETA